jgi:hypothetical protein
VFLVQQALVDTPTAMIALVGVGIINYAPRD